MQQQITSKVKHKGQSVPYQSLFSIRVQRLEFCLAGIQLRDKYVNIPFTFRSEAVNSAISLGQLTEASASASARIPDLYNHEIRVKLPLSKLTSFLLHLLI
jgi:hypothetical protein